MIYQDKPPSDQVFEGNLKSFDVKFLNDSKLLQNIVAPRYLFYSTQVSSLHVDLPRFCDSSEKAYAALCYVRFIASNGIFQIYYEATRRSLY